MKYNPVPDGGKFCFKCRQDLPADAFNGNKGKPSGLASYCRECSKTYYSEYRLARYAYYVVKQCQYRAGLKSITCSIVPEDIQVPSTCPVCSRSLVVGAKDGNARPSADMYDPTLGYVVGNVWIICSGCNRRKQDMSGEDHIAFGQKLIDAFKEQHHD